MASHTVFLRRQDLRQAVRPTVCAVPGRSYAPLAGRQGFTKPS